MKIIEFTHPHRKKHFDFFNQMDQPVLNITAQIDIARLLPLLQEQQRPFTTSMVYLVSRAAHEVPQLRQRIRGQQVVEHELVHPSFTVKTDVDDVFSFCEVKYGENYLDFIERAKIRMKEMHAAPSFEDEHGRDDYLFLSAIPWIAFTNIQHPMHYHPMDSVPRIAWGKFEKVGEKVVMPLSVQVHHALVDGIHLGRFFEKAQQLADGESPWQGV